MTEAGQGGSVSFGAILKKMHLESRSGRLIIESPDGKVVLHLRDGKIVGIDVPTGGTWAIGEYLVGTGSISERRMLRCLRLAEAANVSPEKIAVDRRFITQDVALRFVELHAREAILPLFTRVGIMVRFTADPPVANPLLPPISVPFLIKEGSKRAAEWPALIKRIPTFDLVYDKDPTFLTSLRRAGGDAMDPFKVVDGDRSMGANERIVYFFVNGKRNVRQLTRVSGLDLYSTCRALYNLEARFMVKTAGESSSDGPAGSTVFPLLIRVVTFAALAAALAALAFYLPGPLRLIRGEGSLDLGRVDAVRPARLEQRIRETLEEVWLLQLALPAELESLPGFTRADFGAAPPPYEPLPGGRYLLGETRSENADPARAD